MAWVSADIYSSVSIYICNSVGRGGTEFFFGLGNHRNYILYREHNVS
jgi:hypothetical protein